MSLFQKEPSELAIGVIGAGRVGRALAIALERAGYRVKGIARRTPGGPYSSADALVSSCDLIFLAVPDSALEGLAIELPWRVGQGVVHTSGASGLDVLRGVTARGAHAGGLHPLQAFPDGDPAPERFAGTTCGIEGPPALAVVLDRIATRTGARPLRLDGANRALYHASAVFASNFAIALLVAARRAWALSGLPEAAARESLLPLLSGAVENARELPLERALSGPVARGDTDTVSRHLRALGADPALRELYRALSEQLLDLELGHSSETRAALRVLLDEGR